MVSIRRRGYPSRQAYHEAIANGVINPDLSIILQGSNPSSSSITDGSDERFLDDLQSGPNTNPSYQDENTSMVNRPSAPAITFPSPRQSSSEIDLSIAVSRSRIENGQSSGSSSNIHADANSETHSLSISSASSDLRRRQEARIRAFVERLRADNIYQFELPGLVVQEVQNGDVDKGLTEEAIMTCIGHETFESAAEETPGTQIACTICQEDCVEGEEIGRLDCAHKFHIDCIKQWLVLRNKCPICRRMALMPIEEQDGR